MSSSIALLTRNNFIAAKLTFHSEVDGVKSVLTTKENIFKAFAVFLWWQRIADNPKLYSERARYNEISIPMMLKFERV